MTTMDIAAPLIALLIFLAGFFWLMDGGEGW